MESLGWRQRRGSSPAARRGARQRAGLTPVSASNILSCERETHQTSSGRSNSLDADHGIYGFPASELNFVPTGFAAVGRYAHPNFASGVPPLRDHAAIGIHASMRRVRPALWARVGA
jgi:hypothetical protein